MANEHVGYLTMKALSAYSGLSVRTLRTHVNSLTNPLPAFKIGGALRIRRTDFDAWVEQFRVKVEQIDIDAVVNDLLGDKPRKPKKPAATRR